mgnify:CR=1
DNSAFYEHASRTSLNIGQGVVVDVDAIRLSIITVSWASYIRKFVLTVK